MEVWKKAKIRNRYNQVPHLTQDTIYRVYSDIRQMIVSSLSALVKRHV